jgi:hypothetical protein
LKLRYTRDERTGIRSRAWLARVRGRRAGWRWAGRLLGRSESRGMAARRGAVAWRGLGRARLCRFHGRGRPAWGAAGAAFGWKGESRKERRRTRRGCDGSTEYEQVLQQGGEETCVATVHMASRLAYRRREQVSD